MPEPTPFRDRHDAGQQLAGLLIDLANRSDTIVLGLPRGGVPVAAELAARLAAPLDAFTVRKLGVPGQPELAMGAIATGGIEVINEEIVAISGATRREIEAVAARELTELARREAAYRASRPTPDLRGRIAIVVDDGLATGTTMQAAVTAIRQAQPRQIVVAVPIAAPSAVRDLAPLVDRIECLATPTHFRALGEWYLDFTATSDEEVIALLREGSR